MAQLTMNRTSNTGRVGVDTNCRLCVRVLCITKQKRPNQYDDVTLLAWTTNKTIPFELNLLENCFDEFGDIVSAIDEETR